jgi:diadenosine tetraphosphatase ApaH/serine/threonine PP2A family protein phosphatase
MRIAILSDVHANLPALTACLVAAAGQKTDRIVFLGDLVGYGAEPGAVVDIARDLIDQGAVAIKGNHDAAVRADRTGLNADAHDVIVWTRSQLTQDQSDFLADLPMTERIGDVLLVHSEASRPERWIYVDSADVAQRSIAATDAAITVCGHIHQPAVYGLTATGKIASFRPVSDVAIPLLAPRRWLIVAGSVGQPRDGISSASYVVLDTATREVTFKRAAYDIDEAADAILAAGLPQRFADRLYAGW